MAFIIQNNHLHISQRKLRRLAKRALRIAEAHRGEDPAIDAIVLSLIERVKEFIEIYDAALVSRTSTRPTTTTGRKSVEKLRRALRKWVALLSRDVPLAPAVATLHSPVPEDVIGTAERLLVVVTETQKQAPETIPFAEQAIRALTPDIEAARKESAEARDAIVADQERAQAVRDAATRLQKELVTFRRILRAHLGPHHLDYLALRAHRLDGEADEALEEGGAAGKSGEGGVEPAPESGRVPLAGEDVSAAG